MAAIDWQPRTRGGVIAKAAAEVADRVGAKYLVAFTQSGDSAKRLARYRSRIPVLAFTPDARVRSQLALTWGVETFKTDSVEHTDEMVRQVDEQLLAVGRVEEGDLVVIIAGSPPGHPRLHQRPADPPDGRRHQRGRTGVPSSAEAPGSPAQIRTSIPTAIVERGHAFAARHRDAHLARAAPRHFDEIQGLGSRSQESSDRLTNCHRG